MNVEGRLYDFRKSSGRGESGVSEVINVNLYGGKGIFGGRETPLEASIISCSKHNECSFFKKGQCLAVRSAFSPSCKFGSERTVRGYTSRAQKYHKFKSEWQGHEQYKKLSYPPIKLGMIGDQVVFPYSYVRLEETETGFKVKDPSFGSSISYVGIEKFTTDLIYRICTFRPQAMMGGEISDYQKKTVPLFLAHLEEVLPEKYEAFIKAYSKYANKIDHVGRKAYLKTIKPTVIYKKSRQYPELDSMWQWDGKSLIYQSGFVSSFSVIKDYEIDEIKLMPSDKTVVEITSNDQVDENTVFVD